MKMAKERMERDLERLQNKEDSNDSLRRRLRETEVQKQQQKEKNNLHYSFHVSVDFNRFSFCFFCF